MRGLADYRLLAQIGAGRDGTAYRAEGRDGPEVVELRVLSAARADAVRWPRLVKRLNVLARLEHPTARRVVDIGLGDDPPFVALELDARPTLAAWVGSRPGSTVTEALGFCRAIASGLAASHRIGLAHGGLDPSAVVGDDPDLITLDYTGLDTAPPGSASRLDGFRPPESSSGWEPTFQADVYSLGALALWLLKGNSEAARDRPGALGALLDRMLAADPDERPTAGEVERELASILGETDPAHGGVENWGMSLPSATSDVTSDFSSSADSGTIEVSPPPLPDPLAAIRLVGASVLPSPSAPGLPPLPSPALERLGRFRLLEKLGEGGMGEVYKAEDEADGTFAAVKVLRRDMVGRSTALLRFRKEARLLAQVKNPYVTNLLEVNEDSGVHYIVLEYVDGRSLDRDLDRRGRFDESTALAIASDVARGLMDAHRLGIVHRDVKPANILLVGKIPEASGSRTRRSGSRSGSRSGVTAQRVKLSDFGLARHAEQGESQGITQAGVVVGTPTYMSPEQCSGGALDARTDVYSLGVTLYQLVAGRPPFQAEDWRGVIAKHMNEPPPSIQKLCPEASEGFCRVVEKALAKSPDSRYADASAMLDDLERLLRGEPTGLPMHPVLPDGDPKDVMRFDFVWELDASPRQLWPHVSNTDRLDRAIGFGAVRYTTKFDPARGVRRFLEGRKAGMPEAGEEHPYEWVEGRRLGVFREYERGPFRWVVSVVELTDRVGGGTTLTHRLRLVPRGMLVRLGAGWGVGTSLKKELEKVYLRIDAAVTGKLGPVATVDPFEAPPGLDEARLSRMEQRLGMLTEQGIDLGVVEGLRVFLTYASDPELARIRPIALARGLGLPEDAMVAACLRGASVGLFVMLWDLLCPVCRIPSEIKETLRDLTGHGHCEACNLDFELDFANSVELVFRVHPQVREADVNTYCASGPAHSRHVVAQVRVHEGERFELDLELAAGAYRLVGPQLGWTLDFRVRQGATARRLDLSLTDGPAPGLAPEFGPGGQMLGLTNDSGRELLVRVERTAPRDDALTAARASSMAVFRELFPAEVLAPGRLVSVSNVTLLVTALDQPTSLYQAMGDARAFAAVHEQFRLIDGVVRKEGGAVVKTVGEGVLAAFTDPDAAVRAGLLIPAVLASGEATRGLRPRVVAHRGPAMAATLNDHLDYFGTTVHQAMQGLDFARAGTFVLTRAVASDPSVAERLDGLGLIGSVIDEGAEPLPFGPLISLSTDRDATLSRSVEPRPEPLLSSVLS